MSKIDVTKIVSDMQKLYAKDKRATSIITTGSKVKKQYTLEDVVPLPEGHPLKKLMGLPGIPYNKIIEIGGPKDTGKSTLAMGAMASAQQHGIQVILWDSEDKYDAHRFETYFSGNNDNLLMIKTNEILKGGELVRRFITAIKDQDKDAKIFLVWDSIGGSQSRSHAEKQLDDEKSGQPGQDAKEIVSFMKTLVALINKYPDSIATYAGNQIYNKIGFMQHGNASSGGPKKDHYFSFSMMLKNIKTLTRVIKGSVNKYGVISRATVTKNHLSQGETSIHQLDFTITAKGASLSDEVIEDAGEE